MKNNVRKNQKGSIIIVAVFLLLIMSVLMISLSFVHQSDLEAVANQIEDLEAFYCAESGMEYALYNIRADINNPPTWPPINGTIWSNQPCVTNVDTNPFPGPLKDRGDTYTVYIQKARADINDLTVNHYLWVYSQGSVHDSRFKRNIRALIRRSKTRINDPLSLNNYYAQFLMYQEM